MWNKIKLSSAELENNGRGPGLDEEDGRKRKKEKHEFFLGPVSTEISANHRRGYVSWQLDI